MSIKIGDRVMRSNLDYGVMVGTVIESKQTDDGTDRERLRIKWDGGVRTWNLASVVQPLSHDGYIHLVEDAKARSLRYQVKNRFSREDKERNMARQTERYAREFERLFGRKWGSV